MTSLDKFQTLDVNVRESFLSALGMFRELDAAYRVKINDLSAEVTSKKVVVDTQTSAPMSKNAERLRERIALDIWEPTTRRDLVDRLTNLVVNKIATARDLQRAVVDAKKRRDVYERTGGRDGVETLWKALGYWAKCRYEEAGFEWTATSSILENCPFKSVQTPKDEEQPKEEEKLTYEETKAALDEARRNLLKRSR